jgi:hypothetical protein
MMIAVIPRGWVEIPESIPGEPGDKVEINCGWYDSDFHGHRSPRYHRYIRRVSSAREESHEGGETP